MVAITQCYNQVLEVLQDDYNQTTCLCNIIVEALLDSTVTITVPIGKASVTLTAGLGPTVKQFDAPSFGTEPIALNNWPTGLPVHRPCGQWGISSNPVWEFIPQGDLPVVYHAHEREPRVCGHWHRKTEDELGQALEIPMLRAFDAVGGTVVGWLLWYTGSILDAPLFVPWDINSDNGLNLATAADMLFELVHGKAATVEYRELVLLEKIYPVSVAITEYELFEAEPMCCNYFDAHFIWNENMNLEDWNASGYATSGSYEHHLNNYGEFVGEPDYPRIHTGEFYDKFWAPWSDTTTTTLVYGDDTEWFELQVTEDNNYLERMCDVLHQMFAWVQVIVDGGNINYPYCGEGTDPDLLINIWDDADLLSLGCVFLGTFSSIDPDTYGQTFIESETGVFTSPGGTTWVYGTADTWPETDVPIVARWSGDGTYYNWCAGEYVSDGLWCACEARLYRELFTVTEKTWDYLCHDGGDSRFGAERMDETTTGSFGMNKVEVSLRWVFSTPDGGTVEFVPDNAAVGNLREYTYSSSGSITSGYPIEPVTWGPKVASWMWWLSNGHEGEILATRGTDYAYLGSPVYWPHNQTVLYGARDYWWWLTWYRSWNGVFENLSWDIPYANTTFTLYSSSDTRYGAFVQFVDIDLNTYWVNVYEKEFSTGTQKRFVGLYSDYWHSTREEDKDPIVWEMPNVTWEQPEHWEG